MHLTYVLSGLAIALLIYWIFKQILGGDGRRCPPGPYGVPFLGYLPFLGEQPHLVLTKLGSKYGSIFSIGMGTHLGVVLHDWKSIKAALVDQSEVFSGRPILDIIHDVGGRYGIIGTDGKMWKEQRRFSISRLRDLGFGKRTMEAVIQTEVDELCAVSLEKDGPGGLDMKSSLFVPLLNVIWGLVAGKRFYFNDESLPYFKNLVSEFITLSGVSDFLFIPQIFINMGLRKNLRQRRKDVSLKLLDYMETEVKSHRSTLSDEQRDFLDSYLLEIDKQSVTNSQETTFSETQLKFIALNFFLAGVETTANTLGWSILFMTLWPEVQEKIQKEMNAVLGETNIPTLEDRRSLPYTNAVIMEVQRMASIVPLSIAHRNMKATELLGHHIPKDCVVIPNLWNVSHDAELWGDPEEFRPERFLNEAGSVTKPDHFIPFSAGARICLGETLAKMELFMFFSTMVRRFRFQLPPGSPKPDLTSQFGVTLTPPDYKVIAEKLI